MIEVLFAGVTGLLSSLHCVGMCGPVVLAGSVTSAPIQIQLTDTRSLRSGSASLFILPQLLYHLGRIVSYSSIGLLAGSIGAAAIIKPQMQQGATIVMGILMVGAAVIQLDLFKVRSSARLNRAGAILGSFVKSTSKESRFLVGLLTPLLPCGLLYGMVLYTASLHSPLLGAISMAFFALGSVPALLALATVSKNISGKLRKNASQLAAIFIIAMGIITILRGIGIYHNPFAGHSDPSCGRTDQQTTVSN